MARKSKSIRFRQCGPQKNPAELVLMGVNPLFGLFGGGKKESKHQKQARKVKEKHREQIKKIRSRARRAQSECTRSCRQRYPIPRRNPLGPRYAIRWHTGSISQAFDTRGEAESMLARFHGKGEVIRVNPMPLRSERYRNPLSAEDVAPDRGAEAQEAIEIREGFVDHESTGYIVANEPHIPRGDYAQLGPLVELGVKPTSSGSTNEVQRIHFSPRPLVICDTSRRQIYFAGGEQRQSERDLPKFTSSRSGVVELGQCRSIVYVAAKYHPQAGNDAAGKLVEWQHEFGEENGILPKLFYDVDRQRLLLRGGDYRIEDRGIVN